MNPGQLANHFLRDVSPDFAAAKGHGADPGISLGEFLEPGSTDFSDLEPNKLRTEFEGFALDGWSMQHGGFPVSMPLMLGDLSPESSGGGDPSFGTADQGERIFGMMVDYIVGLIDKFSKANTRD